MKLYQVHEIYSVDYQRNVKKLGYKNHMPSTTSKGNIKSETTVKYFRTFEPGDMYFNR